MPRLVQLVALGAVLLGIGAASAGSRSRSSDLLRLHNTAVTITVPYSAFDRATGRAVVTVNRAVLAEVHASKPWILRVRSDRAFFTNSYGGDDKPCADLAIRVAGQPDFRPLSTAATPILAGDKTNGWDEIAFDLRFTALLTDATGTYTLNLLFDFN